MLGLKITHFFFSNFLTAFLVPIIMAGSLYLQRPENGSTLLDELAVEEEACFYENNAYVHGSPVNSSNFCQPCICFRGNIMCRVIKCPGKPSPDCVVAELKDSCCPVYECPRIKLTASSDKIFIQHVDSASASSNSSDESAEIKECEAAGGRFKVDEVIPSLSSPCLECRCMATGFIRCHPLACKEEERHPLFYKHTLF